MKSHMAMLLATMGTASLAAASVPWSAMRAEGEPVQRAAPVEGSIITIQDAASVWQIDTTTGCSVSAAWAAGDPARTNLINTHDLGRYVQASFYSGPQGYDGCEWSGSKWPWNPIAAGDCHGNSAELIGVSHTASSAKCTIRPKQWACDNVACECTFTVEYSVVGSALHATVTLNNDRSDHTAYGIFNQEIPAVYTNGFLDKLVGYTGSKPCTNDPYLKYWDAGWNSNGGDPWVPGNVANLTEPWMAFTQANTFGLGVWSDKAQLYKAGFSGRKGSGGTKDPQTGYIAPLANVQLAWNAQYSYNFALIMGNLPDIRQIACGLKDGSFWADRNATAPYKL